MTSPRARWLAARTRNAARHGLLIAGAGAIVMIATLLMFILLPRQADRALSNAITALPPSRDTLALRAQRAHADSLRLQAEAQRTAAQVAKAATLADVTDSLALGALQPAVDGDSLLRDLAARIARARQSPLVESFRVLGAAPALQRSATRRASVNTLRDSIEALHRDREAYAALSGPDARYADLTARLTARGAALVALADRVLHEEVDAKQRSAMLGARAPTGHDSTLVTSPPLLAPPPLPDSLLDVAVRHAADSVARLDSLIAQAQRFNAELDSGRSAMRARLQVNIPPVAMLFASLVLGLTMGFAVSVCRELFRPTVGDVRELEEITRSRVIVHYGLERARLAERLGRRDRRGEAQAAVLTPTADAWPLLHLALSNIGDTARHVQVLADKSVVAGAIGLNLASVAARESRATVLVDATPRAGAVLPLLPPSALVKRDGPVATGAAHTGRHEAWDATRSMPLGRDTSVDLVLPRGASGGRAPKDGVPESLEPLLRQYDFVVFVTDSATVPAVPPSAEIVLCARLGVTPLDWVSRTVRRVAASQRRIRAVVLWADEVPLAGARVAG